MPSNRLTAEQIDLIQSSFTKVVPIAHVAADLFYARLFQIAPALRPMFPHNIHNQGRKLMTTLGMVVSSLRSLETIFPAVRTLAVKHVAYGVTADHYAPVGQALIWTLERGRGDAFAPEVKDAWRAA